MAEPKTGKAAYMKGDRILEPLTSGEKSILQIAYNLQMETGTFQTYAAIARAAEKKEKAVVVVFGVIYDKLQLDRGERLPERAYEIAKEVGFL